MASTKTIVKKATRRRGTVSLTKVRKAVDSVYAKYSSGNHTWRNVKVKPRAVGKTRKASALVATSR